MTKTIRKYAIILALVFLAVFVVACKKEKKDDNTGDGGVPAPTAVSVVADKASALIGDKITFTAKYTSKLEVEIEWQQGPGEDFGDGKGETKEYTPENAGNLTMSVRVRAVDGEEKSDWKVSEKLTVVVTAPEEDPTDITISGPNNDEFLANEIEVELTATVGPEGADQQAVSWEIVDGDNFVELSSDTGSTVVVERVADVVIPEEGVTVEIVATSSLDADVVSAPYVLTVYPYDAMAKSVALRADTTTATSGETVLFTATPTNFAVEDAQWAWESNPDTLNIGATMINSAEVTAPVVEEETKIVVTVVATVDGEDFVDDVEIVVSPVEENLPELSFKVEQTLLNGSSAGFWEDGSSIVNEGTLHFWLYIDGEPDSNIADENVDVSVSATIGGKQASADDLGSLTARSGGNFDWNFALGNSLQFGDRLDFVIVVRMYIGGELKTLQPFNFGVVMQPWV